MSIQTFWDSSLYEILDILESYARRKKQNRKQQLADVFLLAEVLTAQVSLLFSDKKEIELPHPWDYAPELFEKEKESYQKYREEKELEEYKQQRIKYIQEINRRREQGLL